MRSDGHLEQAKFLSYDVRYPINLPLKSWITKLIIKHFHERGKPAAGTNQTLAALSTRYWVIAGREAIRDWENECAECRRRKAKVLSASHGSITCIKADNILTSVYQNNCRFSGPFHNSAGTRKT